MYEEIVMGGIGGQGIMVIGNLLAQAAFLENLNVTYMPIYGVEKRGGQADCTVIISSQEIGSPIVGSPKNCIIMSRGAMEKYAPRMKPQGILLYNSSLIGSREIPRQDLQSLAVPANEMALELGNERLANMIVIGAFAEKTRIIRPDSLISALPRIFDNPNHPLLPANTEAIRRGAAFARQT